MNAAKLKRKPVSRRRPRGVQSKRKVVIDLGPVATKWFEVTVALTGAQMIALKTFINYLRYEPNRRRFAEKMLPARGRTPTLDECRRLDALRRVEQAINLPKEVSEGRAFRRIEKQHLAGGGLRFPKRRKAA
jgi:hypothetical protein